MNPHLIKRALKLFIRNNESALVSGLSAGGDDKQISQITTSRFTQHIIPISIWIFIPEAIDAFETASAGENVFRYSTIVANARHKSLYSVELHIADYSQPRPGEDVGQLYELHETDDITFDTFVSRLIELFRDNTTIPPPAGAWTIEVSGDESDEDRRITRRDYHAWEESAEGLPNAAFYTILSFDVEACQEPDPLP